ncbi:hypothetical protein T4D_5489 [Trichinella pseudospiralis]|uniref:Uncharacterized protein n=1 Tax=Trichinella pseudospiralis TaxID=6337 RepID=A0A0V1FD58_TRIPS|nr:hypothetical protein T4D_5489 [Trichinella pseudospiralis]
MAMINIGCMLRVQEVAVAHLNKFGNHTSDPRSGNAESQSHRLFLDEQNKTNTVMQPMNAGYRTGGGSVRVLHILTLAVSRNFVSSDG